jgi:hypothetical protein
MSEKPALNRTDSMDAETIKFLKDCDDLRLKYETKISSLNLRHYKPEIQTHTGVKAFDVKLG